MTDAELWRKATTTVREIQQMRAGGFSLTGSELDREAYARRLLELLPPADDGKEVTAEWLKAVGFINEDEDETTFWTVLFDDLNPAFTIDVDTASTRHAGWIGEAEDDISWPHDICNRGQVRDICRALGVTLQEPKP